jgi:PleD family two-component response regulator
MDPLLLLKAIVLGVVSNHLALLRYGERDTLTGLLNRTTLERHFGEIRIKDQQSLVELI